MLASFNIQARICVHEALHLIFESSPSLLVRRFAHLTSPTIVEVETAPDLIFSEVCSILNKVLILLASGGAGLPNRPLKV
jgi:hypothetical protein